MQERTRSKTLCVVHGRGLKPTGSGTRFRERWEQPLLQFVEVAELPSRCDTVDGGADGLDLSYGTRAEGSERPLVREA